MSSVLWPCTGSSGPWIHLEDISVSYPACVRGHTGMTHTGGMRF